jgi:hypothetical protein
VVASRIPFASNSLKHASESPLATDVFILLLG